MQTSLELHALGVAFIYGLPCLLRDGQSLTLVDRQSTVLAPDTERGACELTLCNALSCADFWAVKSVGFELNIQEKHKGDGDRNFVS